MPESFVVFIHSLGECERIASALEDAEPDIAADYSAPVHEPENIEEWGPLLSSEEMLALGEYLEMLRTPRLGDD